MNDAPDRDRIEEIRERFKACETYGYTNEPVLRDGDLPFLLAALDAAERENERLREALGWLDFIEDVELDAGGNTEDPLTINITRTLGGWRTTKRLYAAALASAPPAEDAP